MPDTIWDRLAAKHLSLRVPCTSTSCGPAWSNKPEHIGKGLYGDFALECELCHGLGYRSLSGDAALVPMLALLYARGYVGIAQKLERQPHKIVLFVTGRKKPIEVEADTLAEALALALEGSGA